MSKFKEYLEAIKSVDEVLSTLKTPKGVIDENQVLHTINLSIKSTSGWIQLELIALKNKLQANIKTGKVNLEEIIKDYKRIVNLPKNPLDEKNKKNLKKAKTKKSSLKI